jgi:hypothetical protein
MADPRDAKLVASSGETRAAKSDRLKAATTETQRVVSTDATTADSTE